MKYVRLIFRGKVLNYERHLTYFQFSVYWKTIESSLEDLNLTRVTTPAQYSKKNWMDENCGDSLFIVQILDVGSFRVKGSVIIPARLVRFRVSA